MEKRKSFKNVLLSTICENMNKNILKEYSNFQPNLFDQNDAMTRTGEFNVNGEKVIVEPSKFGKYNVYKFGPALGDYLAQFDEDKVAQQIAEMYLDDENEMSHILEYANPDDVLLFHTSKGKNIEFPFIDVSLYINGMNALQKRNERYAIAAESMEEDLQYNNDPAAETEEDADWMIMWKNNQLNKNDEESYVDYLNRLKGMY